MGILLQHQYITQELKLKSQPNVENIQKNKKKLDVMEIRVSIQKFKFKTLFFFFAHNVQTNTSSNQKT